MAKRKWTKKEIEKFRRIQGNSYYYNKEDSNFIVPKAFGAGWSVNWANPITWVLALAVISLFVLSVFFS